MAFNLKITDTIWLPDSELDISFIRSSGPGGQNVNKVATAAQLRFDLKNSPSLPEGIKHRAGRIAGSRLTSDGEIVITASTHRSQNLNRDEAVSRLLELLRKAATPQKRRVATRPTLASKRRRLETKSKRSSVKKLRQTRPDIE